MNIHNHSLKLGREEAMRKNIWGPYSCVACRYFNFFFQPKCNNCGYQWETDNQRLCTDEEVLERNAEVPQSYWDNFLKNQIPGEAFATQDYFDVIKRESERRNPQNIEFNPNNFNGTDRRKSVRN